MISFIHIILSNKYWTRVDSALIILDNLDHFVDLIQEQSNRLGCHLWAHLSPHVCPLVVVKRQQQNLNQNQGGGFVPASFKYSTYSQKSMSGCSNTGYFKYSSSCAWVRFKYSSSCRKSKPGFQWHNGPQSQRWGDRKPIKPE